MSYARIPQMPARCASRLVVRRTRTVGIVLTIGSFSQTAHQFMDGMQ
jgi:hypothetical protein